MMVRAWVWGTGTTTQVSQVVQASRPRRSRGWLKFLWLCLLLLHPAQAVEQHTDFVSHFVSQAPPTHLGSSTLKTQHSSWSMTLGNGHFDSDALLSTPPIWYYKESAYAAVDLLTQITAAHHGDPPGPGGPHQLPHLPQPPDIVVEPDIPELNLLLGYTGPRTLLFLRPFHAKYWESDASSLSHCRQFSILSSRSPNPSPGQKQH